MAARLTVADGRLRVDAVDVGVDDVEGFHERWSTWTGRGFTEVVATADAARRQTRVVGRIGWGDGYGDVRRALRAAFPKRPFDADWSDGAIPAAPLGGPVDAVTLAFGAAVTLGAGAASFAFGPLAGAVIAIAGLWPVVRLRDRIEVREEGLRIGPPWAASTPWARVESVRFRRVGRAAEVWSRTRDGSGRATVPLALLPALRGRLERVGGIVLSEATFDLDDRYARWRGPAAGIPWGMLVGTLVCAAILPDPWRVLLAGGLAALALGLLGAAVEARATGWGFGGVAFTTACYAVVLVAWSLAGM